MSRPGGLGLCAAVVAGLTGLTSGAASARELDVTALQRTLAPVARRLAGSGISCQSIAAAGGVRHRLHLASVRFRASERVVLRGGAGVARRTVAPYLLEPDDGGLALSGSVDLTVWQGERLAVAVNVSGVHAGYHGQASSDAAMLLAVRAR
jgi:hypothetical protein